jgi:5-methylcytosine-specific restriction endonuclease McrA
VTPELQEARELRQAHREALKIVERSTLPPNTPRQIRAELANDQDLRWRVFKRDGYRCRACGADVDLTVDHIVPVIHGGSNTESNLQTLCRTCNSRKATGTTSYMPPPTAHGVAERQRIDEAYEREAEAVARQKRDDALRQNDEVTALVEENIDLDAQFAPKMERDRWTVLHSSSPSERREAERRIAEVVADARTANAPIPGDTAEFWAFIYGLRTKLRADSAKARQAIYDTYKREVGQPDRKADPARRANAET